MQPDRDARQAGLGEGQLAPGVQHGKAGPVGGRAGAHYVADEQADTERRRHRVVNIAAAAPGSGPMARFDIQPTDMCRGRRVMVGSPEGNSIDCSQPTTTCCANWEVPRCSSASSWR